MNNKNENVINVTQFSKPILNYIKEEMIKFFSKYKEDPRILETFKLCVQRYVDVLDQIQTRDADKEEDYDFDSYEFPKLTAAMIAYLKTQPSNKSLKKCIKLLDPSIEISPEEQQKRSILHIIQWGGPARFDMPVKPHITTIQDIKIFIKDKLLEQDKENPKLQHALRIIYNSKEIANNRLTIDDADIQHDGTIFFVFNLTKHGLGGKKTRKNKHLIYLNKKIKQLTYRLNKKVKKSTMRKCDSFCKNDYMAEMDKIHEKTMDLYKKHPIMEQPPREFTKEDRDLFYHMCKKNYCNPSCVGYTKPPEFYKKIKHGFQKNTKRVQQLKKKGALSECEDPDVF
jgi:hypothetical protein